MLKTARAAGKYHPCRLRGKQDKVEPVASGPIFGQVYGQALAALATFARWLQVDRS
jgi:hypothetical protein